MFNWLFHTHIRSGEDLYLYDSYRSLAAVKEKVEVEGWGKYAAVRLRNGGAIRRDLIKRDIDGRWFYVYAS